MQIVDYIHVTDDHDNEIALRIGASPVCKVCGTAISHRFKTIDGDWVGSECAQGDSPQAKKMIRLQKWVSTRIGKKTSEGTIRGVGFSKSGEAKIRVTYRKRQVVGDYVELVQFTGLRDKKDLKFY